MISASGDGSLKVWELENGRVRNTWQRERLALGIAAVAPMPDGRRVLWANGDSAVTACTAAMDGRTIVVGETLGRVHVLRLEEV